MFNLKWKKAIVTGSAKEINKAQANVLNEYEAEVACIDLSGEVIKVTDELCKIGTTSYGIWQKDLTDRNELTRAFFEMLGKLGTMDLLVNGAGILLVGSPEILPLFV